MESHPWWLRRGSEYKPSASSTELGWYFMTDLSFTVPSPDKKTPYVRVLGLDAPTVPDSFFWDPHWVELAAGEKELLRTNLKSEFPEFSEVARFYSDHYEQSSPPPIQSLDGPTIRAALDDGCHFLSITSHGSPWGSCYLDAVDLANSPLQNLGRYFVAFADSCSTASPDEGPGADCLGEILVKQPQGAVAYVGNTRMSGVGVGDDYERSFWCNLRTFGRLGPGAGTRPPGQAAQLMTHNFIQLLYGDPEMPVWTGVPKQYEVIHSREAKWGGKVDVLVRHDGKPLARQRITLMAGWTSSLTAPAYLRSKTTQASGRATFELPSIGPAGELSITLVPDEHAQSPLERPNFKPYMGRIPVDATG